MGLHALGFTLLFIIASQVTHRLFYSWILSMPGPREKFPFTSLFTGALIVKELIVPSSISGFFSLNLFRFCGKISFSLYLLHPFAVALFQNLKNDAFDALFFNFLGSIALASLSF